MLRRPFSNCASIAAFSIVVFGAYALKACMSGVSIAPVMVSVSVFCSYGAGGLTTGGGGFLAPICFYCCCFAVAKYLPEPLDRAVEGYGWAPLSAPPPI